ncbi:MAG TPA: two-component regulator propeller domain-containing protein, partial [Bryobacteraceae bacterium]|nr:two-component regulator propeller domain-containing protein [Bryobacteraceae bacterium]
MSLFLLAAAALTAQQLNLKQYGQEQGLMNLVAQCMLQDRAGYVWVGTQAGLFRYDGSEFRGYSTDRGLPGAWILGLHETSDGTLWVATQGGLARRAGERFEAVRGPAGYEISGRAALSADAEGTLYAATNKGLLSVRRAGRGGPVAAFEKLGIDTGPVFGVHVDVRGSVWLGCRNRVLRFDRGPGAGARAGSLAARSHVIAYGRAEGLPDGAWNAVLSDRNNNVWVRSAERLMMLPAGARRFVPLDRGLPQSTYTDGVLNLDAQGRLFVATDLGLAMRSGERWELIDRRRGLPINAVGCFMQDREGSIWIGLSGSGVVRWVGSGSWEAWTPAEGLSNESIWNIRRDRAGTIWVGTDQGLN